MQEFKTLYDQPLVTLDRSPPLTIKVVMPVVDSYEGGTVGSRTKNVTYVLFDVLPDELKQRVITCIDGLAAQK